MGAAASEDPETEFYGAIGSSLFNYACFLLGRERVQIRVAVPGPLRRGCHALRLDVSREPRDECQRRVAAGSDSGRREEELPGLVLVEDPSRPRLPSLNEASSRRLKRPKFEPTASAARDHDGPDPLSYPPPSPIVHIYRNLVAAASFPRARRAAAGSVPRCPYKILDLSLLPSMANGALRVPGRHRGHHVANGAHVAAFSGGERVSRFSQA